MATLTDLYDRLDDFLGNFYGQTLGYSSINVGDVITEQYVNDIYEGIQKIAVHQTGSQTNQISKVTTSNTFDRYDSDYVYPTGELYDDPRGKRKSIQRYYDVLDEFYEERYTVHPSQVVPTGEVESSTRFRPWRGNVNGQDGIQFTALISFNSSDLMRLFLNTGCSIDIWSVLEDGTSAKASAWRNLLDQIGNISFSEVQNNWNQDVVFTGSQFYSSDMVRIIAEKVNSTQIRINVRLIDDTTLSGNNNIDGSLRTSIGFTVSEFYWNVVGSNNITDALSIQVEVDYEDFLPPESYILDMPKTVEEGDIVTVTLTTNYVSDGELVAYSISGVFESDITKMWLNGIEVPVSLVGNFEIASGNSILEIETAQDPDNAGKRLTLELVNKGVQRSTAIIQIGLPINEGIWCVSVIDEDSSFFGRLFGSRAARDYVDEDYRQFKSLYPNRRLFLLVPVVHWMQTPIKVPSGWASDEKTEGPYTIVRDFGGYQWHYRRFGDPYYNYNNNWYGRFGGWSDWYSICRMDRIPDNGAVALAIDNSGSMRPFHVRSSIDILRQKLEERNIRLIIINMPSERWINCHIREYSD